MVYTTQRFKVVPKAGEQPISIGETPTPSPITTPLGNLLQQLFPGTQPYQPIEFPTPTTVSDGGIPDVPGGGGTTPAGLGEGEIVGVQVPSSAASGSSFLIKTTFKNKGTATANFSLRITIPALSVETVTPTVTLTAGQQSIIESTIILPNVQQGGNFPGAVELRSVTTTNVILFQDSEAFTLAVVGSGTTSGGTAAAITPSATTVQQGQSISINCINFGANEIINFVAKVGTTTVSTDTKTAGANGAAILNTLTFATTSPLGTAVITATGATSGKIATAQVTVVSSTTPTPTTTATVATNKTNYVINETIQINGSNFAATEFVAVYITLGGVLIAGGKQVQATTSGTFTTTLTASQTGGGHVNAKGVSSNKFANASINIAPTTPVVAAAITLSGTTVQRGKSVAVACVNFGSLEIVDIVAKVGTTQVASDNHTMNASGAGTEPDLTFSLTSPLGGAIVTATGRSTHRTATASVTVLDAPAVPVATISSSKSTYTAGETIAVTGTGYGFGESVQPYVTVGGIVRSTGANVTASSTGTVSASVSAGSTLGGGHVHLKGLTTLRHAEKGITVVSAGTTTVAQIIPSATSVQRGASISVQCNNFGTAEIIDFTAKVGTTTVATDFKQIPSGATSVKLETLTFSTTAPLGTAVITAKGRTSLRTATANVNVIAATATVTPTLSTNKTTYTRGETISCSATGLRPGEMAFFSLTIGGVETSKGTDRAVSSTGTVSGTLNANGLGGGHAHVRGRTSGIHVEKGVTIVSGTTTTTTASISAPTSVHDGDTFTVTGRGFQGGERVTTTVSGTWRSSDSSWNNKTFSASTTVTASSTGTFSVAVKTPEVPSGVSTTATIRSKGLTSLRTASRTISVI